MLLVNGGFLHYTDMKKFLKNLPWNHWADFEIFSQECSLGDPFQNCFRNFDPSINMALMNGLYGHEEKNLLRNGRSDFEVSSQESGLTLVDVPISQFGPLLLWASCLNHLWAGGASKIFNPLSSIWVFIADTGSFWSLRSDTQMDIKLFTELLLKKKIHQKTYDIK